MGWVYLIGESDIPNHYKIGSTRSKDVNKRLKQLQTGNSSPLYIHSSFETQKPFKLEKMLHNRFKSQNMINEWFELDKSIADNFTKVCKKYQDIIDSLKNNPYF